MGFEHSVANMYFIPVAMLIRASRRRPSGSRSASRRPITRRSTWPGFVGNLVPVTIGNIIGGTLLVGVVYWLVYLRHHR